jgi:riboflavin kinase/FMN adenylyltransferase
LKLIHLYYPLQLPIADLAEAERLVLAIGDFDGVHIGHRRVIGRAVEVAAAHRLPACVMTFNPHPREVLGHSGYSRYLAPIGDKLRLFESLCVDYTFVVTFDLAFARVSPEKFVEEMLVPLGVHTVVVGFDFTFGHKGKGTVETLRRLAEGRMNVEVVPPYLSEGEKVSSTLIREHLHLGELGPIRKYLGRYYAVQGKVVQGDRRGRQIGFPTANLEVTAPYVIPRNGVYAVRAYVDQVGYDGVMNIGTRPTFLPDEAQPSLEVHLLDFSGDLYGRTMRVEFVHFLRPEARFPNVDMLVEQIRRDIEEARHLLSSC